MSISLKVNEMRIRITFTDPVLGGGMSDPVAHADRISAQAPTPELAASEVASLPEQEEDATTPLTVFYRDENGGPCLLDYQIRGFLKEALGVRFAFEAPALKVHSFSVSYWTHKKVVDNAVFVTPRHITLTPPPGTEIETVDLDTRALRCTTMRGERIALASSEMLPAGTTAEFEVETLHKKLDELLPGCFDYGAKKGIGQWRNSGRGRFTWELLEDAKA